MYIYTYFPKHGDGNHTHNYDHRTHITNYYKIDEDEHTNIYQKYKKVWYAGDNVNKFAIVMLMYLSNGFRVATINADNDGSNIKVYNIKINKELLYAYYKHVVV